MTGLHTHLEPIIRVHGIQIPNYAVIIELYGPSVAGNGVCAELDSEAAQV